MSGRRYQWEEGGTNVKNVRPMGRMKDQWEEAGHSGRNGTNWRKDESNGKRTGGSYRIKVGPMARRVYLWKEGWTCDLKLDL
jgi:hypothetical protein